MITERRKMKRTEKENNDIQGESKIRRDECKRNFVKKNYGRKIYCLTNVWAHGGDLKLNSFW